VSENLDNAVPSEPADINALWNTLRQAREALGLSIGDVSAHLKLTPRQIDAIERGDLSVLPGIAFARGFVRNYARFLGLDAAIFVRAIEAPPVDEGGEALVARMNPAGLGPMPFRGTNRFAALLPISAVVLVLFALLCMGLYFRWFESRDEDLLAHVQSEEADASSGPGASVVPASVVSQPSTQAVASMPAGMPQAIPAPVVSATQSALPATSSVPAAKPLVAAAQSFALAAAQSVPARAVQLAPAIVPTPAVVQSGGAGAAAVALSFEGDSWVEVRDATGKTVFSRLNPAGSSQNVQGTPPFALVIGNASKVKVNWRGKAVDLTPYIKIDVARVSLQ